MDSVHELNFQQHTKEFKRRVNIDIGINPDSTSTIKWAPGNTLGLFSVKIIGTPTHDS